VTTPSALTVGLVQMSMGADASDNVRKAAARVRDAAAKGANVVCLPELYRSPYFCQREDAKLFDLAETVPGPSTEALGHVAREAGVVVVVPLFERRAPGLYHNTAVILDTSGEIKGLYRKMHIPDDPAFYEKYYFTPGDLGFKAFDTKAGKIGTLICWDQWYPTAIGWHPHEKAEFGAAQRDAWRTVQRSHAIANGVYVAVVNRVGHEIPPEGGPGLEFWGSSFVADPFGVVVAEASTDKEEILVAKVDTARMEDVRRNWPFLRDRRVDAYGGMDKRFLD
jgi:N-carbamoylputrescine amidase